MADDRHTSMAFVAPHVASKYDLLPHPPTFQPHFHSCQTALPLALHMSQVSWSKGDSLLGWREIPTSKGNGVR